MMDYIGEILVIIVGFIMAAVSVGYISKVLFSEMAKYNNKKYGGVVDGVIEFIKKTGDGMNHLIDAEATAMDIKNKEKIDKMNKTNKDIEDIDMADILPY